MNHVKIVCTVAAVVFDVAVSAAVAVFELSEFCLTVPVWKFSFGGPYQR